MPLILRVLKNLSAFIIFFGGFFASGQILRIDKNHLNTDSSNYFLGSIDLRFSLNNRASTANDQVSFVLVANNVDIVYIGKESANIFINNISFVRRGNEGRFINHGYAHLRRIFSRKKKFTPVIFTQFQYDEVRSLVARRLFGGGYRWNILSGEKSVHMSALPFYEYEEWKSLEGEDIIKELVKFGYNFGGDLNLTKSISLNFINYYQIGYDDEINGFRNRFVTFMELKDALTKHLKIKTSFELLWDERPIIPLNSFIYDINFGFEYHFD